MLTEYHDSMLICHLRSRLASLSTCKIVASASIPSRQSQQIDCLLSKFHICKFNYCTFQALTCKNSENIAAIPQCSWSQCQGQSWFQGFLNFQMLSQSLPFPRLWVYLLVYPFLFVGGGHCFCLQLGFHLLDLRKDSHPSSQRKNMLLDTKSEIQKLSGGLEHSSSFFKGPTFQCIISKEGHQISNDLVLVSLQTF